MFRINGVKQEEERLGKEGDTVLFNCAMSTVVNGKVTHLPQLERLTEGRLLMKLSVLRILSLDDLEKHWMIQSLLEAIEQDKQNS